MAKEGHAISLITGESPIEQRIAVLDRYGHGPWYRPWNMGLLYDIYIFDVYFLGNFSECGLTSMTLLPHNLQLLACIENVM